MHTIILVAHACAVRNKEHTHSIICTCQSHFNTCIYTGQLIVFMMLLIMIVLKSKSHLTHAGMLCVPTQQKFFMFNDDCLKISRALEFTIKMHANHSLSIATLTMSLYI